MKVVDDHRELIKLSSTSSFDEEIFLLDQDINRLQVNGVTGHKRCRKKVPENGHVSAPVSPKQGRKCGRPANPIPRHKRDSHIKAEHKRRDKIQKGFDSFREIVPALEECSPKESKASMLLKTAEHCRHLKAECKTRQDEASVLRQEIEALSSEIHKLQSRLPAAGIVQDDAKKLSIDEMYQEYVRENTEKNWKFWIFSFIMDPLFSAYKKMTEKCPSSSFIRTVQSWAEDHLSLVNLRPGVLSSLRGVIKKTDIMDKPEMLPLQALKAVRRGSISGESNKSSPAVSCHVTPAVSPKPGMRSPCIPASPIQLSPRIPSSPVASILPSVAPASAEELNPLQDMIASMDTWHSSESLPVTSGSLMIDTNTTTQPVMEMQTSQPVTSTLTILPRMTAPSSASLTTDMEVTAGTSLALLDCQTSQALASELEMSDSLLDSLTTHVDIQSCQLPDLDHILSDNLYTTAPSSFESVFTTAQSTMSMTSGNHNHQSFISVLSQSDAHKGCVSSTSTLARGKHL